MRASTASTSHCCLGARAHIDLLVLNQRDPTVTDLIKAFPFSVTRPSLVYYRTSSGSGVRRMLLETGYETSAHWETSAWGENTIAWRADRCADASRGMLGKPLWASVAERLPVSVREPSDQVVEKARKRGGAAKRPRGL